ncbi:hypothetical protein EC968_008368 [Mortierella alpina]|nr:hypothetical protein EC968_008368 [Mortierella alpina]
MASIQDLCNPEPEDDQHYRPAPSAPAPPPAQLHHPHHPARHHAQHYHPYPPPSHPSEQQAHYHHHQQHYHPHPTHQPPYAPLPPPLPQRYGHLPHSQEHPPRHALEQTHPAHPSNDTQVQHNHNHHHHHPQNLSRSSYEPSQDFYARPAASHTPYGHPSAETEAAGHASSAPEPSAIASQPEPPSIKTECSQQHSAPRRVSKHLEDQCLAKIKIVQQPLHARMCGFGEKDRRPIDPPPIVQLILDEKHDQHPSKRLPQPGVKGAEDDVSQEDTKMDESHEAIDNEEEDETYQLDEDDDEEDGPSKPSSGAKGVTPGRAGSLRHKSLSPSVKKRSRRAVAASDTKADRSATEDGDRAQKNHHDEPSQSGSEDGHDAEEHAGQATAQEQDPLFVLHVSLWSHDGKEVRNMIATPGQSDPPKLTRILMGSLVVSPVLLNNAEGVPGWFFSFPDLSIRTEGVYTLKFSLMRFGSYDFLNSEDGHASTLVAEEISEPFTVFSAKKFPGMTESTELSKAFAKQGLKIPIRNDLRARKADKE